MSGLPAGWILVPLSEVADVRWGDTSKTKASYVSEGFTAFSASGADGYLESYDFEGAGIVLSAIGAACGKVFWAEGKWSAIKNTICIVPDESRVDPKYLYLALADPNSWAKRGAAQPFIRQVDARSRKLPLPPLEVQQRIVENLEDHFIRLDKALADIRQGRELLLAERRSILHSAFLGELPAKSGTQRAIPHVESRHFDEVFIAIRPKQKALKQKEYLKAGRFPVVDQGVELIGGYSNDESLVLNRESPVVVFGDHTRCIKWIDFSFIVGADGTKLLEPKDIIFPRFAYFQLLSKELRSKGYARHFSLLRKEIFWVPSFDKQKQIVEILEGHLSRIDKTSQTLDIVEGEAQQLRRSLLHAAFTGQLTKEDSND